MLRASAIVTFVVAGALSLTGACGGKSAAERNQSGSGATAGEGGSGGSTAGRTPQGGEPDRSSGGSTVSTVQPGTGSGAAPATACSGPATTDTLGCAAAVPRWTHSAKTGLCVPFIFGGCEATQNNYATLADCQQACRGQGLDYDACEHASDCVVVPASCCGPCDNPRITAHDLIAYHRDNLGKVAHCNGDIACEPCAEDPQGTLRYFVPACVQGQCAIEDLRESELTACQSHADCKLRLGSQCCSACGEGTNLIAVRNDGSFEARVCGDDPPGCPECEGTIPTNFEAVCGAGRCQVHELGK